eukprot:Gregarina_sp_Poly_1__8240@NODE_47_length_17802_cov_82_087454_g41_i0_p7_GENE_NODE_47_length_17802_cov_82_087454_g41_i0NODE_47_length_17802_cov_82_087454_g41_i0_p7_ORF_typecomplete_len120_score13_12_NODE_47_length_17802_cov_82_087454_g41_i0237596
MRERTRISLTYPHRFPMPILRLGNCYAQVDFLGVQNFQVFGRKVTMRAPVATNDSSNAKSEKQDLICLVAGSFSPKVMDHFWTISDLEQSSEFVLLAEGHGELPRAALVEAANAGGSTN